MKQIKRFIYLKQARKARRYSLEATTRLVKLQNGDPFDVNDLVEVYRFNEIYQFFNRKKLLITLILHTIKGQSSIEILSGLLDLGSFGWYHTYSKNGETPFHYFRMTGLHYQS
jgi:hypothetical protein